MSSNSPDEIKNNGPVPATPGAGAPAGVPTTSFCLYIRRIRQEERAGMGFPRTVSEYQCYWEGEALPDLEGQMVERGGPGDNSSTGVERHRRIEAGKYPLSIQDGEHYKTYDYVASGFPFPGVLLDDTGHRSAILLHPCHQDEGYLSSIGCINPAIGLKNADSRIDLADSRTRVIAIIQAMKLKLGSAFPRHGSIPGAVIVIESEPA
jgi:hypothetical protein